MSPNSGRHGRRRGGNSPHRHGRQRFGSPADEDSSGPRRRHNHLDRSDGITPTINSIKGTAGSYQVAATGTVPNASPGSGTASTLPSQFPLANVKGTIGGAGFTLNIILTLPASLTSSKPQSFGKVTGTFRNQAVAAALTANINSSSFAFVGTIGSLHIAGHVSKPTQHDHTETAHATFNITK